MRIKEILDKGIKELNKHSIEESTLKAKILLSYVLNIDKAYFMIHENEEVDSEKEKIYNIYLEDIIKGKPVQYITNKQEFMGLTFYVDENVLIPQPDTEILVEETIKEINRMIEKIQQNKSKDDLKQSKIEEQQYDDTSTIRILDLCTGSGAIAISIATYLNTLLKNKDINIYHRIETQNVKDLKFKIYATDISEKALEVAKKNAKMNQVEIHFIQSDMFQNMEEYKKEKFDIIVSNPPYIETNTIETLSPEVQYEPHLALDGGEDGLKFYRMIAQKGKNYVKENGRILLEIGYNQQQSVVQLLKENNQYSNIKCIQDLAGNDRIIKIK